MRLLSNGLSFYDPTSESAYDLVYPKDKLIPPGMRLGIISKFTRF